MGEHPTRCIKCGFARICCDREGSLWCCTACGHCWPIGTTANRVPEKRSLRVFVSYSRRDAQEFARDLVTRLQARGYHPWVDKSEIPYGTSFPERIEEGIRGSDLLIAVLSEGSVRPEGFCRKEWLFAQATGIPILPVRIHAVTPPIVIISLNYLDAVENPEAVFETLSTVVAQFQKIGRVATGARQVPGTERPWWARVRPFNFEEELARYGGTFVGREWLFEDVRRWLGQTNSRLLLLTADAGYGKSAIAAQMTARFNVRGVHFCSRSNASSCAAAGWVRQLVYQLALQLPWYRQRIERLRQPTWDDPVSLFRLLVADPLRESEPHLDVTNPWVFVTDGLDESFATAGAGLADLLADSAHRMPSWLRMIVTTRPDRSLLARFHTDCVRRFAFNCREERNLEDLRAYIEGRLGRASAGDSKGGSAGCPAEKLGSVADGNFLFAKMTLEALEDPDPNNRLALEQIGKLPSRLGGLYHAMFRRRFRDLDRYKRELRPLLECLAAARAALPEELLLAAAGLAEHVASQSLGSVSQLLNRTREGTALFHKSLADWLADPETSAEYGCVVRRGHERLADACLPESQRGREEISQYTWRHLPAHLAEAGRWKQLLELFSSRRFDLLCRWVEKGEVEDGTLCLEGLIDWLPREGLKPVTEAGLATQLARIYSLRGEYAKSQRCLEQHALPRTSWFRGRRERAVAIHELGSLRLYRGDRDGAVRAYRKALRLCLWGWPRHLDEAAANWVALATVAADACRLRNTIQLATAARRCADKLIDVPHAVAARRWLAWAYRHLGQFAEATSQIDEAMAIATANGIELEKAVLLSHRGWLHYDEATCQSEPPAASETLFRQAITASRCSHELFALLDAMIGLGWTLLGLDRPEEAEHHFRVVLEHLRPPDHPNLRAGVLVGLAGVRYSRGDNDDVASEWEKAAIWCEQRGLWIWTTKALTGLGAVCWHRGNHRRAEQAWVRARGVADRISPHRRRLAEITIATCRADPAKTPS